jgi:hypothetical protein
MMAEARPRPLQCDVRLLAPDAATIDALARFQLAARKAGRDVALCGVSRELAELLDLFGLCGVLRVEVGRQPEEREERVGIEEERELGDLPP